MKTVKLPNFSLFIVTFSIVLGSVGTSYSQSYLGPRVGMSISKQSDRDSKYTAGYLIGGTRESSQEGYFGSRTSIVLAQYGTINKMSDIRTETFRFSLLQLNAAFKARLGSESLNAFICFGGYGSYGIGKVKKKVELNQISTSSTVDYTDTSIPKTDFGFLFSAGASMYLGKGILQAELQYNQSLFDFGDIGSGYFTAFQPCVSYLWEF